MSASRGEHYRVTSGAIINNRYEIIKEVGCGNFSKVYAARDLTVPSEQQDAIVALKLLKKEYAHDAKFEHDILKAVTCADTEKKQKVLREKDFFVWNNYPCFIFERKGVSLRYRKLGLVAGAYTREDVKKFCKEMIQALAFLHFQIKLVHTDLKPDNILLDFFTDASVGNGHNQSRRKLPSAFPSRCSNSTDCIDDSGGLGNGWTIVDFGSASFYLMNKLDSDLISTRPYRAPEVILCTPWYWPADTWSMACIFYEVYTGKRLFDVNDDYVHLAFIEHKLQGTLSNIPTRKGAKSIMPDFFTLQSKHSRKFFDSTGKLLRMLHNRATAVHKPLVQELGHDPLFLDLISRMLALDPANRIRADDALKHPFLVSSNTSSLGRSPTDGIVETLGSSSNGLHKTSMTDTNTVTCPLLVHESCGVKGDAKVDREEDEITQLERRLSKDLNISNSTPSGGEPGGLVSRSPSSISNMLGLVPRIKTAGVRDNFEGGGIGGGVTSGMLSNRIPQDDRQLGFQQQQMTANHNKWMQEKGNIQSTSAVPTLEGFVNSASVTPISNNSLSGNSPVIMASLRKKQDFRGSGASSGTEGGDINSNLSHNDCSSLNTYSNFPTPRETKLAHQRRFLYGGNNTAQRAKQ